MKENKQNKNNDMASNADRHILYEKSVQDVAEEYRFVSKTFRKLRGRAPRRMREDFCGTASMCCDDGAKKEHVYNLYRTHTITGARDTLEL